MDNIINYFNDEIRECFVEKNNIENEINSKKIICGEINKTIEKLLASENDTDSIFRANISNKEFHNNEITSLKQQLADLSKSIRHFENSLEKIDEKINKLNTLLEEARDADAQLLEMNEEEDKPIIEEIQDEETPESLVDILKNISSRMELAVKFGRVDYERAKMELNLARVKLMLCIDDLEKQ